MNKHFIYCDKTFQWIIFNSNFHCVWIIRCNQLEWDDFVNVDDNLLATMIKKLLQTLQLDKYIAKHWKENKETRIPAVVTHIEWLTPQRFDIFCVLSSLFLPLFSVYSVVFVKIHNFLCSLFWSPGSVLLNSMRILYNNWPRDVNLSDVASISSHIVITFMCKP